MAALHGQSGRADRDRADSGPPGARHDARGMAVHDSVRTILRAMRENTWRATAAASTVLTADQARTAATMVAMHGMDAGGMHSMRERGGLGGGPGGRLDGPGDGRRGPYGPDGDAGQGADARDPPPDPNG